MSYFQNFGMSALAHASDNSAPVSTIAKVT